MVMVENPKVYLHKSKILDEARKWKSVERCYLTSYVLKMVKNYLIMSIIGLTPMQKLAGRCIWVFCWDREAVLIILFSLYESMYKLCTQGNYNNTV